MKARKAKNDLADATVPAGTCYPLSRNSWRLSFFYAAASFFDHWKSVSSRHMRCRMTASFRATAILAFLKPMRFHSLWPQAFSLHHCGTRVSNTPLPQTDSSEAFDHRILRSARSSRPHLRRGGERSTRRRHRQTWNAESGLDRRLLHGTSEP